MDLGSKIAASLSMSSVAEWSLAGALGDSVVALVVEAIPSRLLPSLPLVVPVVLEAIKVVAASEVASKAEEVSVEVSEAIEAVSVIVVGMVVEVALATKEVTVVGMEAGLALPMVHPAAEVAMAVVRTAMIEETVVMAEVVEVGMVATIVVSPAATESPLAAEIAATTTEIETVTEIDMAAATDATTTTRGSDLAKTMGMTILVNGGTDHSSSTLCITAQSGGLVGIDPSSLTCSRFDLS
jgi:hypothetical protein